MIRLLLFWFFRPFRPWRSWWVLAEILDELAQLVEQGQALPEAVDGLTRKGFIGSPLARFRRVFRSKLAEGARLSDLARKQLPPPVPGFIRMGEETGDMPLALRCASNALLDKFDRRWSTIQRLGYPALLVFVLTMVLWFLSNFVLPQLGKIHHQLGQELSFLSLIMLSLGRFVRDYLFIIIIPLVALLPAARTAWGREILFRRLLPGARGRRKLCLGHAFQALATCLEGGMALPRALEIAGGASGSIWYQGRLRRLAEAVRAGESWGRGETPPRWIPADLDALLRVRGLSAESCRDVSTLLRIRGTAEEDTAFTRAHFLFYLACAGAIAGLVIGVYLPFIELVGFMEVLS